MEKQIKDNEKCIKDEFEANEEKKQELTNNADKI